MRCVWFDILRYIGSQRDSYQVRLALFQSDVSRDQAAEYQLTSRQYLNIRSYIIHYFTYFTIFKASKDDALWKEVV